MIPVGYIFTTEGNHKMADTGLLPQVVAAWKRAIGTEPADSTSTADDEPFTHPPNPGQRCPLCGASVHKLHSHLGTPDGEGCPETPLQRDAPSP